MIVLEDDKAQNKLGPVHLDVLDVFETLCVTAFSKIPF